MSPKKILIMNSFDKIINQLKDSSGEMGDNMHMLNEIVPVDEQMKYFHYSKHVQKNKEKLDRNYMIAKLFTPEANIEDKRYYLTVLAGIVDVAAYRAIETYHSSPLEPELGHWSALALAESKILLDAELSGEKQFFVSTGLGGKDKKLRYFSVIATADRKDFTNFQLETLTRELKFQFEQNNIELEELTIKGNYVKMFLLCGLSIDPRECVKKAVIEANEFGNYIDDHFLLTNIKQLNDIEITELLNKKSEEKTEDKSEDSTEKE